MNLSLSLEPALEPCIHFAEMVATTGLVSDLARTGTGIGNVDRASGAGFEPTRLGDTHG